jgi:3-hydroxybutyryl-CoA dehydratase
MMQRRMMHVATRHTSGNFRPVTLHGSIAAAAGESGMAEHGFYLEDLSVGMTAVFGKTVTEADIMMFAGVSGDTNPVHLNEEFACGTAFEGRIAHGMLTASFISTVIGTKLPGPGCIYLSQSLKFLAPVRVGDTVKAVVEIVGIDADRKRITMDTKCLVGDKPVLAGEALIMVQKKAKAEPAAA